MYDISNSVRKAKVEKITMNLVLTITLFLQVSSVYNAPAQMHLFPGQSVVLQKQLIALQNLQALQKYSAMNSPVALNMEEPLQLIYLPQPTRTINIQTNEQNDEETKNEVESQLQDENDADTVVIESEPNIKANKEVLTSPGNGKFSIGSIISAIPFLPIEINVPDSISWAYNGISGLISGIGQIIPFRRPTPVITDAQDSSLMATLSRIQMKKQNYINMPVLIMPIRHIALPIQV